MAGEEDNLSTQLEEETGSRLKNGCMFTFVVWCTAIAFLYLTKPLGKALDVDFGWLEFICWILLTLICPAFGVLFATDLKSFLDWQAKRTGSTIWFRFLILLGYWLLAAVVGCMGVFLVLAAIHPDDEHSHWLNQFLFACISLPFFIGAWLLLIHPFRKYEGETKAEQQAAWERWNQRMKKPDFLGIEAAGEMHLPFEFKMMYRPDSEWQTKEWILYPLGLDNDSKLHMILSLEPADTESLWRNWNKTTNSEDLFLCFASHANGYYYLKLEKGNDDPAVYEVSTDDGYSLIAQLSPDVTPEKIADHFSQFINWPKEPI